MRINNKGFTLIELLVVIAIIAVLSTVGYTIFTSAQRAARDVKRKADLRELSIALELYYAKNENYAPDPAWCDSSKGVIAADCVGFVGNSWVANGLVDLATQGFVKNMPLDPINNATYYYAYEPVTFQTQYGIDCPTNICAYMLSATLENSADPKAIIGCNTVLPTHNYCVVGGGAKLGP